MIDTPHTYLYYALSGGRAIRYPIGVGHESFTRSDVQKVSHKPGWPDWVNEDVVDFYGRSMLNAEVVGLPGISRRLPGPVDSAFGRY